MALRTQRVAPQFLEQLNSLIPGTGLTVAETLGFRPVSTKQNLGAPLAGFKTPVDLSVEERIFGRPKTLEDKPLLPPLSGSFTITPPVGRPQTAGRDTFVPDSIAFGRQTGFFPGTPPAKLVRVLSANENAGAGVLGAADATGATGAFALSSSAPSTFASFPSGVTTPATGIAFGALSGANRRFASGVFGGLDRPGAGAGRRRLAGQLVRRVRNPEPQGAVLRTRPLSSLQPRRRASVDPVKKRLLNTLIR